MTLKVSKGRKTATQQQNDFDFGVCGNTRNNDGDISLNFSKKLAIC